MAHDVSVKVGAETSALNTGLAQAKHAVSEFKEHASEQVSELGSEFLAAFALGAVIEQIHELIEGFSQVGDQAERLGISAESVQRLALVAKTSGLEMDGLAKALIKGTKNAVDAVAGNEELSEAFEKLGVEAKEFVNLAPEEQLVALAEGYEKSGQNAETLNAILKALGKSGTDLIPILAKGPDGLKEELAGVHVASDSTVAHLKEAGDAMETIWNNIKAAGATAIDFVITRTKALGTGIAAIVNWVSNLTGGLDAANKAFDDTLQAAADLNLEEEKTKEDEKKKRKPVDTEALEAAKSLAEQKKKDEEELAKQKEENAKKEDEAYMRSLILAEKKLELEARIKDIRNAPATSELDVEKNKGKILDLQKELENVNKDIEREQDKDAKEQAEKAKKAAEQTAKEELKAKKDALKDAETEEKRIEKLRNNSVSVDSLRSIGGGLANVNYGLIGAKDDIQKQQLDYAKMQVDKLTEIVKALEPKDSDSFAGDGSFN